MKKNSNTLKENLATAAASAAGAMAGVAGANAFNANAAETEPEPTDTDSDDVEVIDATHDADTDTETPADAVDDNTQTQPEAPVYNNPTTHAHRADTNVHHPEPTPEAPTPKPEEPVTPPEREVEVLSYERITTEDGSEIDEAVLKIDDTLVVYADVDLDGYADVVAVDLDHDGQINLDTEAAIVQGEGISMQPFQNATGFNPHLAQNHLPDYVDDGDTGDFMA